MEIIILILLFAIFLWQSYLILYKGKYFFVSSLRARTEEEIEELEKSGYIRAMGLLYFRAAMLLFVGLINVFTGAPYAFELTLLIFILVLTGGHIYIQKYEQKKKRKRAYWTNTIAALLTIAILVFVFSLGFRTNELIIAENQIEITGPYGVEVAVENIEEVVLLDKLPKVERRTNGFAAGNRRVGNFRLAELGKGKLFIHGDTAPYLLIQLDEGFVIINHKDSSKTEDWYQSLDSVVHE